MSDNSRLLELVKQLETQVAALQQHLNTTGQPCPTFDAQTPDIDWIDVDDVRFATIENLIELQDLISTPREILQQNLETDYIGRHALDRWQVYDAIPVGETRTYEQIAKQVGRPVKVLRWIMRHAISQRIFCEPKPGVVAHTSISKLLTENRAVRDYYASKTGLVWPAATRLIDAIDKWPTSKARNECAHFLIHGKTLQQTLESEPIRHARYDNAMAAFTNDRTQGLDHVVNGYNWASLGKALMVDVGGGLGTISKHLAKVFPDMTFIVQDRPEVIENAKVEDPEIKDRVRFLEHDFFTEQPIKNGDIYYIRSVMMEWEDEDAIKILRALTPSLKRGARVVIQDGCTPAPGSCQLQTERRLIASDMVALCLVNGTQRGFEDWQPLFERASPGYKFHKTWMVPNTDLIFAEAVWEGDSPEN